MTDEQKLLAILCTTPSAIKRTNIDCPAAESCPNCPFQASPGGDSFTCLLVTTSNHAQCIAHSIVTASNWSASKYMQDNPEFFI